LAHLGRVATLLKESFIKQSRCFRLRCTGSINNFLIVTGMGSQCMTMTIEMINEYGNQAVKVGIDGRTVLLEAEEIDAVIERLGLIRAAMRPEISREPSRTHQYVIEMDPCWHSEKNPLYEGAVLFLRHTGLGWAGFALPAHSLVKLRNALNRHLEQCEETHVLMN
jgi:hypothetical protein